MKPVVYSSVFFYTIFFLKYIIKNATQLHSISHKCQRALFSSSVCQKDTSIYGEIKREGERNGKHESSRRGTRKRNPMDGTVSSNLIESLKSSLPPPPSREVIDLLLFFYSLLYSLVYRYYANEDSFRNVHDDNLHNLKARKLMHRYKHTTSEIVNLMQLDKLLAYRLVLYS